MRDKSKVFIIAIIAAVAVSAYIGGRAIVGAATSLRASSGETGAAPGEIESAGNEAAGLLADMESAEKAPDIKRDPLAPPTAAAPATAHAAGRAPARASAPTYKVTALFLDDNPTAILSAGGGERIIVHVGDEIAGGRVTAISSSGVTVEGANGTSTFSYSENQ